MSLMKRRPEVAGSEAILKPGARVLLGELHGNNETPRLVGELAIHATALGAVRVGLEIPVDQQARIDRFLASAGVGGDRQALLRGRFWTRDLQDGRSSAAMA